MSAPQEPAAPEAVTCTELLEALERCVDEYVSSYEMIGEDEDGVEGSYVPNAFEQVLILDAIQGLLAETNFIEAMDAWRRGVGGSASNDPSSATPEEAS